MADMRRGCEHEKLVDEALRTLLLCKLEQQQDTMVHDHHGVADNDFKLRAQRVYDAYHGLGGNGHGTQINNDIQNAPLRPGWEESHHEHHHQRRQARHGHIDHPGWHPVG